jgi:hypothetical protein
MAGRVISLEVVTTGALTSALAPGVGAVTAAELPDGVAVTVPEGGAVVVTVAWSGVATVTAALLPSPGVTSMVGTSPQRV